MFWLEARKVRRGKTGHFRAFGSSMEPVIPSGSYLTIEPVDVEQLELGDIVVVKVGDETMVHLVKTIDRAARRVEISGTSGPASGWTTFEHIYGICTRIGDKAVPGAEAKARRPRAS